jgi:hypothetical protein
VKYGMNINEKVEQYNPKFEIMISTMRVIAYVRLKKNN